MNCGRVLREQNHIDAMPNQDPAAIEAAILVDYRVVEGWHVFTSSQIRGLYVSNPDQQLAFEAIGPAIEKLLAENEHVHVAVRPALTIDAFLERMHHRSQMTKIVPGTPQPFMVTAARAA